MYKNKKAALFLASIFCVGTVSANCIGINEKNNLNENDDSLQSTDDLKDETHKSSFANKISSFVKKNKKNLRRVAKAAAVASTAGGLAYAGKNIYDSYNKPENPEAIALLSKVEKLKNIFLNEPACVTINGPATVVGDLHSNKGAAKFAKEHFEKKLKNDPNHKLVFLGDVVDRGFQAKDPEIKLETLETVMDLKLLHPENVVMLSGNHEMQSVNKRYGFYNKVKKTYGNRDGEIVYRVANEMFANLPKCAVLKQKDKNNQEINTFLVHGTVPYREDGNYENVIENMSNLNNKEKYCIPGGSENSYTEDQKMAYRLPWNDYDGRENTQNSARDGYSGFLKSLGKKDLDKFKAANNVQRVVSAHDHSACGYKEYDGENYIKIISSPNMNMENAPGYLLDINNDGRITKVRVEE